MCINPENRNSIFLSEVEPTIQARLEGAKLPRTETMNPVVKETLVNIMTELTFRYQATNGAVWQALEPFHGVLYMLYGKEGRKLRHPLNRVWR